MYTKNIILENEAVLLRPIQEADLPVFLELTADQDMWRFFTNDLSTMSGLEEWAKPAFNKERLQFTIIDKFTGSVVGSSAFGNLSLRDQRVEIGWTWLGKKYQGMGINGQVKRLMLAYCFETLDMVRVEFKTDVLNLQARKALRNIGAIEEGVLRSHTLMTKDRRRDTIYYSILIQEWPHVKRENDW